MRRLAGIAAAVLTAAALFVGCSGAAVSDQPDNTVRDETKLGKYEYVWGDEFDGDSLDETKWSLKQDMDGTMTMSLLKTSDVLSVSDGKLKLSAIKHSELLNPYIKYATTYSVQTQDTMNFKFGYLEMRARVPYKHGAWPSLWMKGTGTLGEADRVNKSCMAEVDVFEAFSSVDTAMPNIHKWYDNGYHISYSSDAITGYTFENCNNLANEFHIYGFEWTEKEMSMYIDGTKYMTFDLDYNFEGLGDMQSFRDPLYILINNHIFTPGSYYLPDGSLVEDEDLPSVYEVDWIRLYQAPGEGALYTK